MVSLLRPVALPIPRDGKVEEEDSSPPGASVKPLPEVVQSLAQRFVNSSILAKCAASLASSCRSLGLVDLFLMEPPSRRCKSLNLVLPKYAKKRCDHFLDYFGNLRFQVFATNVYFR